MTVIDRTDATDAEFLARVAEVDPLEAASIAAAVALQRVLEVCDWLDTDDASDLIVDPDFYYGRSNAADHIRRAVAGPPPDGGDVR